MVPVLNRLPTLNSRAIAPTTSSRTTSATMPSSSADTAKLLTRSVHFVENPTSSAWATSTMAVMTQALAGVPV